MAVGVSCIDNLRLDEVFPQRGKHAFSNAWTIRTDTNLLVIDTSQGTIFSDDIESDRDFGFLIVNNQNQVVALISIDHKLIDNKPDGIADCAVLCDSLIIIVEFKTNALGNTDAAVADTFDKAVLQIKETVSLLENRLSAIGVVLRQQSNMLCRIVLSHSFPRVSAARQDYSFSFEEDTGLSLSFETMFVVS